MHRVVLGGEGGQRDVVQHRRCQVREEPAVPQARDVRLSALQVGARRDHGADAVERTRECTVPDAILGPPPLDRGRTGEGSERVVALMHGDRIAPLAAR
ncbi:hypothetical protein C1I63_08935 [Rathayibacter caricis DSM 15933]|uniref:Uncharacterized protein n=1 Tax=Rathayibacter caricis DSM 15933 TaxID=1328867 RepID=A0A2T4UTU1_9MICO|nr:hypothetical protein C1I63_08935 [Rathayibacter caricis DSM 15933]